MHSGVEVLPKKFVGFAQGDFADFEEIAMDASVFSLLEESRKFITSSDAMEVRLDGLHEGVEH